MMRWGNRGVASSASDVDEEEQEQGAGWGISDEREVAGWDRRLGRNLEIPIGWRRMERGRGMMVFYWELPGLCFSGRGMLLLPFESRCSM